MAETTEAPSAPEVRELIEQAGGTAAAAAALGVKSATLRTWRGQRPIPAARLEALREAAAKAQAGALTPAEVGVGGALELRAEDVRYALAEVEDAGEALDVGDRAQALKLYLRRQREASAAWIEAAAAALWARRRVGELLPEPGRGGRGQTVQRPDGLSREGARVCRRLAELPEDLFASQLAEWREAEAEPTTAGLLRLAERRRRDRGEVTVEAAPSRVVKHEPTADATPDDEAGDEDRYGGNDTGNLDDDTGDVDPWSSLTPPDLSDYQPDWTPEPTAAPVVEALEVEADDPREVARLLAQSLEILTAKAEGVAELGEVVELIAQARERAQEVAGR